MICILPHAAPFKEQLPTVLSTSCTHRSSNALALGCDMKSWIAFKNMFFSFFFFFFHRHRTNICSMRRYCYDLHDEWMTIADDHRFGVLEKWPAECCKNEIETCIECGPKWVVPLTRKTFRAGEGKTSFSMCRSVEIDLVESCKIQRKMAYNKLHGMPYDGQTIQWNVVTVHVHERFFDFRTKIVSRFEDASAKIAEYLH